jgi:hypothetical protein
VKEIQCQHPTELTPTEILTKQKVKSGTSKFKGEVEFICSTGTKARRTRSESKTLIDEVPCNRVVGKQRKMAT